MSLPLDASAHGGDRSFERNVNYRLAVDTVNHGRSTIQPNGNILHERRDPDNIDHYIKVVTTPHPKKIITVIRDTSRPFAEEQARAKADKSAKGEVKLKADALKRKKKDDLEKKRARTPKPKNKP